MQIVSAELPAIPPQSSPIALAWTPFSLGPAPIQDIESLATKRVPSVAVYDLSARPRLLP